jgi:hypothetical protein
MAADVALVLLLAGGFLIGFFRGLVRQVMALGSCLVLFVVAAYAREPLAAWLSRSSPQFGRDYALMLSFLVLFLGLFLAVLLFIQFSRTASALTRHPVLDDSLGGLSGLLIAAATVALVSQILDSYYLRTGPIQAAGELAWLRQTHHALEASNLAGLIDDTVGRALAFLLSPVLPADVRAVAG